MRRLSSSLRSDINSSIFSLVVTLLIGLGVYLMFRRSGMGARAESGMVKGIVFVGFLALNQAYRLWKRYKAEQGGA